jgi:hypothetical protein
LIITPLYILLDDKCNKKHSAWQNKCLTQMILIDNWLHAPTHIILKMHHFWSIAILRKWALVEWGELQLWRSWGKLCWLALVLKFPEQPAIFSFVDSTMAEMTLIKGSF